MTALLLAVTTRATIPDIITFAVSAAVVLLGAVGVVSSANPVHAALSLVLTLFGVAVLFIEQDAQFLAVVQVIVYAGAIVVLFLFVIMYLGVDKRENIEAEPLKGQRPLAFALIAIALVGVLAMLSASHWVTGAHHVAGRTGGSYSNVYVLGKSVFTTYLFAFEATAALLVVAIVGAVFLARRPAVDENEVEMEGEDPADPPTDGDAGPEHSQLSESDAQPPVAESPSATEPAPQEVGR